MTTILRWRKVEPLIKIQWRGPMKRTLSLVERDSPKSIATIIGPRGIAGQDGERGERGEQGINGTIWTNTDW